MEINQVILSSEISGLLQKGRLLLQALPSDVESCYDTIKEIVSLLPNAGWSPTMCTSTSQVAELQNIFMHKYYSGFAEFFIHQISIEWLQPDSKGRRLMPLLDCFFLNGPQEDAFVILSRAIIVLQPSVCLFHCIGLIERLFKNGCLKNIFKKYCCDSPATTIASDASKTRLSKTDHLKLQQWQVLLNSIASLPDIILANATSKADVNFFYRDAYIPFIWREIMSTLNTVHDLLHNETSCSILFIAMVIGKLSMAGYSEILWTCALPELEVICTHDFVWRRIVQRIIADIPERCIEMVVTQVTIQSKSYQTLVALFGMLPTTNKNMSYILTYKLLLVRFYDEPNATRVLQNIIGYSTVNSELYSKLFVPAFRALLAAWADGSSLRHRPVQQSLYLCKTIIVCIAFLPVACIEMVREDIVRNLLEGLPSYLDSSIVDIRHMGCFVAEKLSGVVHKENEGQSLCFKIEASDVVECLSRLSIKPEINIDHLPNTFVAESHNIKNVEPCTLSDVSDESRPVVDSRSSVEKGNVISSSEKVKKENAVDSDDSEDELTPYPSSSNKQLNPKQPLYLGQCIEGLTQCDDPDRTEQCLLNVESLVRSCNPTTAAEVGIELCRVLLHLDDRYALPEFTVLRYRSIVATVVVCPSFVAEYLASEFYARNYSIRQRMDILDVLATAANELSEPVRQKWPSKSVTVSQNSLKDLSASHWSEIVRQRLESKTRRFGRNNKPTPPSLTLNRFSACAGSFFYPLLRYFDRQTDACLDLLGADHLLYERLIYALGNVVLATRNLPCSRNMSLTMLEFVRCARHHTEVGVRRAVLYAVCAALLALPSCSLVGDASVVADLSDWLRMTNEHDTDSECRNRSVQGLVLLGALVEQESAAV